jgi:hypothetical protein
MKFDKFIVNSQISGGGSGEGSGDGRVCAESAANAKVRFEKHGTTEGPSRPYKARAQASRLGHVLPVLLCNFFDYLFVFRVSWFGKKTTTS